MGELFKVLAVLPRGVPVELYGELIEELRRLNVTTILDTEGEPLRVGTRAFPDLVTPHVVEAEELGGHGFADDEVEAVDAEALEIAEAAVEFAKAGTDPRPEDALKNVYA